MGVVNIRVHVPSVSYGPIINRMDAGNVESSLGMHSRVCRVRFLLRSYDDTPFGGDGQREIHWVG